MTTRQVAEGWVLINWLEDFDEDQTPWSPWRPQLDGPKGLSAEVCDDGQMVVEGWDDDASRVRVPLAAISALMSAHAEWLKQTAEARKEQTT